MSAAQDMFILVLLGFYGSIAVVVAVVSWRTHCHCSWCALSFRDDCAMGLVWPALAIILSGIFIAVFVEGKLFPTPKPKGKLKLGR